MKKFHFSMTPAETVFFEEILVVMRKHGFAPRTDDAKKEAVAALQAALPRTLVHMIGFENLALSRYCIESILTNTPIGAYTLVLTNNGSTDGTREYFDQIAQQFSHVTVIHETENTGFQAPNERAFAMACARGASFFCPINNDVELPPLWLEKIIEPMDADPKVAVTGPFGGCSRVNADMCGCDDTKLEYLEFSCAAVRVSAVTTPTLFAPFLSFIYGEDLQCCLDLQYRGWKIARAAFRIKHRGSQTAGAHPAAKAKCAEANKRNLAEMRKRYAHWNRVRRFDHPIIVKRSYAAGDILLMTPILRALRKRYALCPIYVECGRPEILAGNPNVCGGPANISNATDALVIDLDGAYERHPERHVLLSYAEAAGLEASEIEWRLDIVLQDVIYLAVGHWVAIHVGPTTWPGKNWPMERWNAVAQWLRVNGYKVLLFGDGPRDASILADRDLRGQQGVQELAGLLSACKLFIGLDSFPAHVAAAVGVPCVVLYGVTDPDCFKVATAPYEAVRSSTQHRDTGARNRPEAAGKTFIPTDDGCMRTITVEMVGQAVAKLLPIGMDSLASVTFNPKPPLKVMGPAKREEFRAE